MIECAFTIDYELYGNGEGSLIDHVYEPTRKLTELFRQAGVKFVCFTEALEFERIESWGGDEAIQKIRRQIRDLFQEGFEIALHLHPQWANAAYAGGRWQLDYSEYNLCTLPQARIRNIVERAIRYLQDTVGRSQFRPISFRAGNWLFQPTKHVASALASVGVKLDSSVFKGGIQRKHGLDYRRACANGDYWRFDDDVTVANTRGAMMEVPIYTEMVPFWRMLTRKRIGLQAQSASIGAVKVGKIARLKDYARLRHPRKFDFCRMTLDELIAMTNRVLAEDRRRPDSYIPMVAIGHSKDLNDFETIKNYLEFIRSRKIAVNTLEGMLERCNHAN